jgi:hypothetical protein
VGDVAAAAGWTALGAGQRRGGPGAVADRDLDAVVALFDARRRFVDRLPSADVALRRHLSAQELPGDPAPRGPWAETPSAAHRARAKGLEWDSSAWPACRRASGPTCATAHAAGTELL